jgi:hypothetical protein
MEPFLEQSKPRTTQSFQMSVRKDEEEGTTAGSTGKSATTAKHGLSTVHSYLFIRGRCLRISNDCQDLEIAECRSAEESAVVPGQFLGRPLQASNNDVHCILRTTMCFVGGCALGYYVAMYCCLAKLPHFNNKNDSIFNLYLKVMKGEAGDGEAHFDCCFSVDALCRCSYPVTKTNNDLYLFLLVN